MPDLMEMLRTQYGISAPPKPMYRRGFKVPARPNEAQIWAEARLAQQNNRRLIWRMYNDILWYRMLYVGLFPEDIEARQEGLFTDEYRSPAMAQELEIVAGFLAGLPLRPQKRAMDKDLKADVNKVLDTVRYWRTLAEERHPEEGGNGPLALEEAKYLTLFGRVINRSVARVFDPEYPIGKALIDPTTFYPVYRPRMVKAFHIYRAPIGSILGDYNDVTNAQMKAIQNEYGASFDENMLVECVEYWDEWYRSVQIMGATIMPVVAHQYGELPFTVGLGPHGEPGAMRTPIQSSRWDNTTDYMMHEPDATADQVYKGLSYIHYMRIEHQQFESIMARMVTALKKAINPPTILELSNEAAKAGKRPDLDLSAGAVNELIKGEMTWNPVPTEPSPLQVETLMTALMGERTITRMPDAFMGANEKSNVSGTAMSNLSGAGMEKIGKWVKCLEDYHGRVESKDLRLFCNIGYQAKYVDDDPTPIMVATSRRGSYGGFELTPEIIKRVGPNVTVAMTRARREEWMALAQVVNILIDKGLMTKAMAVEEFGFDTDIEQITEEWIEDKGLEMAYSNPDFATFFTIPQAIMGQIKEAEGDPTTQQALSDALKSWMELMAKPKLQQQQMQQQSAMQPPQQPQGPQPGGPQPIPTNAGISRPQLGQGPGSVTGQQGGPPPPPGSVQVGPPAQR